jgi:hypothetical protein
MAIGSFFVDPLAEHTATWLLRWIRTQLDTASGSTELGPPPAGVRSAQPSTVILTIFDGRSSAGFTGQGSSLLEAVMSAVGQALAAPSKASRLQLDIVTGDPTPIAKPADDGKLPDRQAREAWMRLTTWQDGLVVGREGDARWLEPTQLI